MKIVHDTAAVETHVIRHATGTDEKVMQCVGTQKHTAAATHGTKQASNRAYDSAKLRCSMRPIPMKNATVRGGMHKSFR